MARVFVTGSTDGLGRAAAQTLIAQGHEIVLHARSRERAAAHADLAPCSTGVAIGDLRSAVETRKIAEQVNAIGRMDAIIHNAGIYQAPSRCPTPEGRAMTLAVDALATYMLTALIERPGRLIYLGGRSCITARAAHCATSDLDRASLGAEAGPVRNPSFMSRRSP